jgi:hypothetical protein
MCVLVFTTIFDRINYRKKGWARHYHKWTYVFMYSNRYYSQIFIKIEFAQQIFDKSSRKIFSKNLFIGNRVVPCWRMDRWANKQNEINSRFVQICEGAWSQYKIIYICRMPLFLIHYIFNTFVIWSLLSFLVFLILQTFVFCRTGEIIQIRVKQW